MKKLLTMESLYDFFVQQGLSMQFNNQQEPIVIQSPAQFSVSSSDSGQLHVSLKACHTELNRNKSFISKEVMEKALPTIYNRPILGNVIQLDDGSYDFHSHDMIINDDGSTTYIEKPIGHIPESGNAHLEYDKDMDKTYVVVDGIIYEDYGNEAADIIRNKESNKVSVELVIYDLSFNAEEKHLEINDFRFNGITALGSEKNGKKIEEGMRGSKMTIKDFSYENNSLINDLNTKIDQLTHAFNEHVKEGVETKMTKFEELLNQYGVTAEDVDFEYENLSDEELEVAFKNKFEQQDPEPETNTSKKYSIEINGKTHNFEVSLDEVIYALETVINDTYSEADNTYYGVKVYEKYVVMVDCWTGKAYKQSYKKKNGSYSLSGDRVEVYPRYLTHEEENALDEMRGKYAQLEESNKLLQAQIDDAKRDEIVSSGDYDSIRETAEFKAICEQKADFSAEELTQKLDAVILQYVKTKQIFSAEPQKRVKTAIHNDEEKPYGSLF
ncbi:MAG: hypothetical protein ACLT5W_01985 [Ruminococcus sp.]